jgi:LmbE family N-acetylglucosaminyl deacetylase
MMSLATAAAATSKWNVVVVGGHPGDPEYGCGGTVARYRDLGHRVTLLYLNRGQHGCGSVPAEQCAATRTAEAEKACRILGAKPVFAGQVDGESVIDTEHYQQFRALLATQRPDIVFTHWPVDNHRDHRAASSLVHDAWRYLHGSFALFYYEVSDGEDTLLFSPSDYVDISAVEDRKRAACYAHASQAPDKFYALQSKVERFRGLEKGYAQAEAFIALERTAQTQLP